MAVEEYADWRGNQVDGKKHGGTRAAIFLYVLVALRSSPNSANFSLVAYFYRMLHLGIVSSTSLITFLVGAVSVSAAVMNFLSDAYIKRATAIFLFGPLVILGYVLLALHAHLPSLQPPTCDINKDPNSCKPAQGWSLVFLYFSLLIFAVGEGCMRACIPPLCGDQFGGDDPNVSLRKKRSLSLHKFANSLGAIFGLAFIVWMQNNVGWSIGFMVCALVVLLGLVVAASGLPLYRLQKPNGSPLTRILQVIVAALKKRNSVIHDSVALQEVGEVVCTGGEENLHTNRKGFLDKACIYAGDTSPWSFCSNIQVEETRAVLKMLPIFLSSILIFLPFTLLMTLTIQVGRTMDRRIGSFQISSASLIAIPTAFHMLLQPVYSRVITPLLRRLTGSPLRRIGAGAVCGIVAACVAALVEAKRMAVAEEHHLEQADTDVPMSVFWIVIQFFLLSVMEVASFNGLVEFIKSEAPPRMRPIAPAVQSCVVGVATWSACVFVRLVNLETRNHGDGRGWLDGANFNRAKLDRFFLLLAAFELLALINYSFWATKYGRNRKVVVGLQDENS
ncbi:hypothetical protein ACP4OV_031039 [Aristida adscensionis]